jgi:predicted MFS family arabinose efflux permease
LGSWVGATLGWRWSFGALSILTLLTLGLTLALVPDAAGQPQESHLPVAKVFAIPGVAAILAVIVAWMLAHNTLYTYIGPYLHDARSSLPVELALLTFGCSALLGLAITGAVIDRGLRPLVLISIASFIAAGVILIVGRSWTPAVVFGIALWGIAFGGAATQLLTAISNASGENADIANSLLGVAFNLAIFTAGVLGAVLITAAGGLAPPFAMVTVSLIALAVALTARVSAFPACR